MAGNNIHADKKIDEIVQAWTKLEKVVTQNVDILERYSKTSSSLPSDYLKQVEQTRIAQEALNKALEEAKSKQKDYTNLKKEEARQIQKVAKVKAQLAIANSKENKEYHKLNEAKKAADKANREEAKSLLKSVGLYNTVQGRINKLTKQYNDLATKKALGSRLTRAEEQEYKILSKSLLKYQGVLKKVDADIGKHQRNVGNYKSGFDGLGFSVAQLSREMPAFANSMQTGLMAISNNIPMLQDEITKLIIKNKELAASGKPTVSIMGQLGKAVFSLTSLLSIGTTLLVVYGDDLLKFAKNAFKGSKALDSLEMSQKAINDTFEDSSYKDAVKDVLELKTNIELAKDGFLDKKRVVKQYNETLGKSAGEVKTLAEAESQIIDKAPAYIKAMLFKTAATKALGETSDLLLENAKKQSELGDELNKLREEQRQTLMTQEQEGVFGDRVEQNKIKLTRQQKKINELTAKQNEIEKEGLGVYEDLIKKAQKLADESGLDLFGGDDGGNGGGSKRELQKVLGLKTVEEANSEFQVYAKKVMKVLENHFGVEAGKIDPVELPPLDSEKFTQGLTKLQQQTDAFINNLKFKVIDDSPLSSLTTFFDGTFEDLILGANTLEEEFAITFNAIGEVAKQTFALINQYGQQNFDAQYERLEKDKENALVFAGEGAAAREQIEKQYDARRRVIQQRQAKAQKDMAMFNAGVTAAQSSLAAYASQLIPGDPTSIVRAKIAAAITASFGLFQVGLIASQKVPQFYKGTEDTGLGGNLDSKGGFNAVLHPNERVMTKAQNNRMHGYKNEDVADIVDNYHKGSLISKIDFNAELQRMLDLNGMFPFQENIVNNSLPVIEMKGGMTASEMDSIIGKHFSKISSNNIMFNERGIKKWVSNGASKTVVHNNEVEFKGFSV